MGVNELETGPRYIQKLNDKIKLMILGLNSRVLHRHKYFSSFS